MTHLAIIILAAGKGTRMKSDLPKVLHHLNGRPLAQYVVQTARQLNPARIVLVVGYQADLVKQAIGRSVQYVEQKEQLGTGHAVAQAEALLGDHPGSILVLYGDMPLLSRRTLQQLVALQSDNPGPVTMLTVIADDPRGFGRIIRDDEGEVRAIVEEVDCTPEQLAVNELNVGVYCFQGSWLWENLPKIELSPKGEYYLTELVGIAARQGHRIQAVTSTDQIETMGVNSRKHLTEAETALEQRIGD